MSTDNDNEHSDLQPQKSGVWFIWGILAIFVLVGLFVFFYFNKTVNQDLSIPGNFAGERKTVVVNGVKFVFRWCPAGSFLAGSPESEEGRDKDEIPHNVTITKGFWMLESEVTQKQWRAVMGVNPSFSNGDSLPVEQVSWNDCQAFCKKCNELGFPFQLPTEAQWEFACRAGSSEQYAGNLDEMTWYYGNSGGKTHSVRTKKSNSWGLSDMHGNVSEWCADWYGEYSDDNVTDPAGPLDGFYRVFRGGNWNRAKADCRSARRRLANPENCYYDLGFRVLRPVTNLEVLDEQNNPAEESDSDKESENKEVS